MASSGDVHRSVSAYGSVGNAYQLGRPTYPSAAVTYLIARTGLSPGRDLLDLGAGTGKLTQLLIGTAARIIAVEPVAQFREMLSKLPVDVRAGRAEQIPLPNDSIDVVTVAAAFHWFEAGLALDEINRVLKPNGQLAILWNERDPTDKTQSALTTLIEPYRHDEPRQADESWRHALSGDGRFSPLEARDFVHHHEFTVDTLVERVKSISFIATLPPATSTRLLERVADLGRDRGRADASFMLPHITHVYVTSLT